MIKKIKSIIEYLGLDWLGIIIGHEPDFSGDGDNDQTLESIEKKFYGLKSDKTIEYGIDYCNHKLSREDERLRIVESKAFTLLGVTGVATAFVTNLAGIFLKKNSLIPNYVFALIYLFSIFPMIMTLLISMKVVTVGNFTTPSISDILKLSNEDLNAVKKNYIASAYYSVIKNRNVINNKVSYLMGAQLWFKKSIYNLLFLTILISAYIGIVSPLDNPPEIFDITPTCANVIDHTQTPSLTPTPVKTKTPSIQITKTPNLTMTP